MPAPTNQPPPAPRPLACDLTAIPPARRADHQALACCPFLTFTLIVGADGGPLWLHLTGDGAIKGFIQAELGS